MTKSKMRISMIGRIPTSAEPSPAPMMVDSEIGVETTRSAPNSPRKSRYWPPTPPRAPAARAALPQHPAPRVAPHFLQRGAARGLDQRYFDHPTAPVS